MRELYIKTSRILVFETLKKKKKKVSSMLPQKPELKLSGTFLLDVFIYKIQQAPDYKVNVFIMYSTPWPHTLFWSGTLIQQL